MSAFQAVPEQMPNEKEHRRIIARVVNTHTKGKFNCTLPLTLTANANSTTLNDARIGYGSLIVPMPQTANASAEIASGNMYIPQTTQLVGSAVIQHTNNAQTDRVFVMGIFG